MDTDLKEALLAGERMGSAHTLRWPPGAPTGVLGTWLGRRAGTSIDFQDYREYQPGDDPRFVDWNVFARTDRMAVKLFREEVLPHLDLIVDGSRSMALEDSPKAAAAVCLAALLATAAAQSFCTRAVWLSGEGFHRIAHDTLRQAAWEGLTFESRRTPEEACDRAAPRLRRMSLRVFISDLLWPGEPERLVRRWVTGGAGLAVVQVLAREECRPPTYGSVRLTDSETGETLDLYVDDRVVEEYLGSLRRWQQAWAEACRACGAVMTTVVAEEVMRGAHGLEQIALVAPV